MKQEGFSSVLSHLLLKIGRPISASLFRVVCFTEVGMAVRSKGQCGGHLLMDADKDDKNRFGG